MFNIGLASYDPSCDKRGIKSERRTTSGERNKYEGETSRQMEQYKVDVTLI